jgi:hypothetical protein
MEEVKQNVANSNTPDEIFSTEDIKTVSEEKQDQERRTKNERIMKIMEKRIKDDNAIVIYNISSAGRAMLRYIGLTNRIVRTIKEKILLGQTNTSDLIELQEKVRKLYDETWNKITDFIPSLAPIPITSWRSLLESYDEKSAAIRMRGTYVVVAYSDLQGQGYTIIKYLEHIRRKLLNQTHSSPEIIENYRNIRQTFYDSIRKLCEEYSEKYNVKIRT